MKRITKRELVRNPALASHLRPGESVQLEDEKEPLVILRRKKRTLMAFTRRRIAERFRWHYT